MGKYVRCRECDSAIDLDTIGKETIGRFEGWRNFNCPVCGKYSESNEFNVEIES